MNVALTTQPVRKCRRVELQQLLWCVLQSPTRDDTRLIMELKHQVHTRVTCQVG